MKPEDYIASFSFDQRLAPYDIQGSIAHVQMLAKKKIIPFKDSRKIIVGLEGILRDLNRGKKLPAQEDIHFAIETELIRRIGEVGKKMHTARSRNDQVALDLKLYTRDHARKAVAAITSAQRAILNCAKKNTSTLMPGFTHLQHGQPIFFAHHILAYAWMLERDKQRFVSALERTDESPLGACALSGTAFPIDRNMTAKLLGFGGVTENSIDSVSDRDFIVEFVFNAALTLTHLSRLAEELVIWSSAEFGYVTLAEPYTSGSSIMPQKRNPDTAELVRGKTARAVGALVQLLSMLKNLTLAYNRDLQEDKPPLFDAADTLLGTLSISGQMIETMRVNKEKMKDSCRRGFLLATELADYLARKGMPFRAAHSIVNQIVRELRENPARGEDLNSFSLAELKAYSPLFNQDVFTGLTLEKVAASRNSYGGTGSKALAQQIKKLESYLK